MRVRPKSTSAPTDLQPTGAADPASSTSARGKRRPLDEARIAAAPEGTLVQPGSLLGASVSRPARLPERMVAALRILLSSDEPLDFATLPASARAALNSLLAPELSPLLLDEPLPNLGINPFDFRRLVRTPAAAAAALRAYFAPGFAFRPLDEKRAVLAALRPLLLPEAGAQLARYHLPRHLLDDPARPVMTLSTEAEGGLVRQPGILHFYAPDPDGRLDPRAADAAFLACLFNRDAEPPAAMAELWKATKRQPLTAMDKPPAGWSRLSSESQAAALRWKDLSDAGRVCYLYQYAAHVDPKVVLHRLTDPRACVGGAVAPASLADKLKWELGGPLTVWECASKTYYDSEDQLWSDALFLHEARNRVGGLHVHNVATFDSPEDVRTLAPHLIGYWALEDLFLFSRSLSLGAGLLDNKFLQPFDAATLAEMSTAVAQKGRIDVDDFLISKLRCLGIRVGLYGPGEKLGAETRMGDCTAPGYSAYRSVVRRQRDLLTSGAFANVPPPPWPGWNAGDPALPDDTWAAARRDPNLPDDLVRGASVPFSQLFAHAMVGLRATDTYRLASPLWAWEKLPGFPAHEVPRLHAAREQFVARMLELSRAYAEVLARGRDVSPQALRHPLFTEVRRFFEDTFLSYALESQLESLGQHP